MALDLHMPTVVYRNDRKRTDWIRNGWAMSSVETDTHGVRDTCAYPGCIRPRRRRAGDKGGKPPIYCDLINENTGKYAHTPLTARREEQRRARQTGSNGWTSTNTTAKPDGANSAVSVERSATVARERAASLLEQFRTETAGLSDTIATALAELAAAADPDLVRAELDDAHRRVERIQFETTQQIKDAQRARDQATAAASQLAKDRDNAIAVRDQAIDDLERAERERDEAIANVEQARADAATSIAEARHDAEAEIERARHRAATDVAQCRTEAAGQIMVLQRQRDDAAVAASRADAIAKRGADDAERLRIEMADLRREHKNELADLRADNKAALADQVAQLREVYDAEITRLTNQIAAMTGVQAPPVTEDQQGRVDGAAVEHRRRTKGLTGNKPAIR